MNRADSLSTEIRQATDVIIIGGGLAGLTAAALAARAGRSVVVLEKANRLGGRALTTRHAEAAFNLGPHALYCGGDAFRLLRELEVPFRGAEPTTVGSHVRRGGVLHKIPRSFGDLVRSRLLSVREKIRLLRFLQRLPAVDPRPLDRTPLRTWLEQTLGTGNLTALFQTFFRVATYTDDWETLSAGAAIEQLQMTLAKNVWYLDDGWQTLIDGLRDTAARFGADVRVSAPARHVTRDGDSVVVRLGDGTSLRAADVVLAVEPDSACRLLDLPADAPLARWNERRTPVKAASLDVALRRLPNPACNVSFDLDRPLYFSVHSASAQLGPEGVVVLHVAKYLRADEPASPRELESQLEAYFDELQPGWRSETIARRFLPGIAVTGALVDYRDGGTAGRPQVATDVPGVYLAGDWVGSRGMLADASAASAEEAVRLILTRDSRHSTLPADGARAVRPYAHA